MTMLAVSMLTGPAGRLVVDRIGLKLPSTRTPIDVTVIDRVAPPSEN